MPERAEARVVSWIDKPRETEPDLIPASIIESPDASQGRHGVYVCCRTEPDTSMAFSV
jgi:hypothetical protein